MQNVSGMMDGLLFNLRPRSAATQPPSAQSDRGARSPDTGACSDPRQLAFAFLAAALCVVLWSAGASAATSGAAGGMLDALITQLKGALGQLATIAVFGAVAMAVFASNAMELASKLAGVGLAIAVGVGIAGSSGGLGTMLGLGAMVP